MLIFVYVLILENTEIITLTDAAIHDCTVGTKILVVGEVAVGHESASESKEGSIVVLNKIVDLSSAGHLAAATEPTEVIRIVVVKVSIAAIVTIRTAHIVKVVTSSLIRSTPIRSEDEISATVGQSRLTVCLSETVKDDVVEVS